MTDIQGVFTRVEPVSGLPRFRLEFYDALAAHADGLFELVDAMLCADGPVKSLVELSLVPEHRRGHGSLYDAVNKGSIDLARVRAALGALPLPRAADGRIVLAVDVPNWLRPDAATSPQRLFCHVYGRGRSADQFVLGWPYSFVAALETGSTSWTAVLDAVRLGPADDATAVTAAQLREVVQRLIAAGHWNQGDPKIWIVADSGYDMPRLAFALYDLPVVIAGRIRSDRVFRFPAVHVYDPRGGRPPKHGSDFALAKPESWPEPTHATITATDRYGTARTQAWDRLHPRLTHRTCWLDHDGPLPVIEGTLVRPQVEYLPTERDPKPVWLWAPLTSADAATIDRLWQAYLRRFDLEHTFRFLKQTLGWTRPRLRDPAAADRWTWLIIAAHTQLRLAREQATELRRPWERPADPTPSHPGTSTPRVPEHLRDQHPSRTCTEIDRPRTRTPARVTQPPPPHHSERRQDPLSREIPGRTPPRRKPIQKG